MFVGAVAGVDDGGVDPVGGSKAVGCTGCPVADHDGVRSHGGQCLGGVLEGFALGDGGALRGEVDDVGGQAFGGGFEGDPGAGGVLEEEVHHGASAQGRELLDLAVPHGGHFLGGVEDADGVGQAEVFGGEKVFHAPPSMTTSLTVGSVGCGVGFLEADPDLLGGGGGQVLSDVVCPDGEFAVAAVDQHGEPDDPRAAEVDDGVQRGTDGAAGVQHVIDEHHDLVVDPCSRELGGVRRPGGLVGEVVAEHGHVQLSDNRGGVHGGVRGCDLAGQPDCQRVPPARNAQQDQVLGAFVGFEDLMGDTSEGAVNVRLVEDNPGRNRCACDRSQRSSPLSPPHRTELKKDYLRFKITTRGGPLPCRSRAFMVTPAPPAVRMPWSRDGGTIGFPLCRCIPIPLPASRVRPGRKDRFPARRTPAGWATCSRSTTVRCPAIPAAPCILWCCRTPAAPRPRPLPGPAQGCLA